MQQRPFPKILTAGIALFLLALGARLFSNSSHFFAPIDPGYRNFEMCDSQYQIRRTEMIIDQYPSVPFKDSYHYYPESPDVPWPPGYNLFLATIGKMVQLFGGDRLAQESAIGVVPSVVDAATVVLFFLLFLHYVSFPTAFLAAGLLSLSTQNVGYSEVGYIDHHYFITFLMVALAWAIRFFEEKRSISAAAGLGALAGTVPFFNVSAVQYALLGLAAAAISIWVKRNETSMRQPLLALFGPALITSFLSALSTPAGKAWLWRYDQTSLFQFGLIAIGGSASAAFALGWRKDRPFNWKPAAAIGLVAATGGLLLRHEIFEAVRFLFVGNRLNFVQGEEMSVREYYPVWATVFTWFALLAPVGIWQARLLFKRHAGFAAFLFLCFFFGLASGLSHFLYVQYFYPWFALAAAMGMDFLLREKWKGLGDFRYAVLLIFLFQAGYVGYAEIANINNGEEQSRKAITQTIRAFAWLRENSPPTSFHKFGDGTPEYSVFAHRDHGHMIVRIAKRPVVVSPFSTPDFVAHMQDYARFYFSANEQSAVDIMKKYRSRYLVLDHRDNMMVDFLRQTLRGEPDQPYFDARATKPKAGYFRNNLLYFDGELRWKSTPSIGHFRLIYETPLQVTIPLQSPQGVIKHSYNGLKIFELVEGALVKGHGFFPGERVVLQQPRQTNTGRKFTYTAYGVADSKGFVEIRVAYPGAYTAIRPNGNKLYLLIPVQTADAGGEIKINAKTQSNF